MLVLSAPLAIRHCQAKVGSAVINRNSWLKGRQPLNPDAPADAANVERTLHSRRNSTPRPAGGERASSRGDALAPSCPSPSVAFMGISDGGWGNKKRHRREEGGQAMLRRRQRCLRAALSARTWPAAEPRSSPRVAAAAAAAGLSTRRGCDCSVA